MENTLQTLNDIKTQKGVKYHFDDCKLGKGGWLSKLVMDGGAVFEGSEQKTKRETRATAVRSYLEHLAVQEQKEDGWESLQPAVPEPRSHACEPVALERMCTSCLLGLMGRVSDALVTRYPVDTDVVVVRAPDDDEHAFREVPWAEDLASGHPVLLDRKLYYGRGTGETVVVTKQQGMAQYGRGRIDDIVSNVDCKSPRLRVLECHGKICSDVNVYIEYLSNKKSVGLPSVKQN